MENKKPYYLGLDVGTNSIGFAAANPTYMLLKHKSEPLWGTHLFEEGSDSQERRMHRTSRRRIDRTQQRVALVSELFAEEIAKLDTGFFIRRKESALYAEDSSEGVSLFKGEGITDQEYHRLYPTIHHLILALMTQKTPHDIRLVYLACAWLVAHRGHFLFDIPPEKTEELLDFTKTYKDFCEYFNGLDYQLPWSPDIEANDVLEILQTETGVRKKAELFKENIYKGKKAVKTPLEDFPFSQDAIITLLSGGKLKPSVLYVNEEYADIESVSLTMDDEEFDRIAAQLGEDGELLKRMRAMQSCAHLIATMSNSRKQDPRCISSSKVAIYEKHRKDLQLIKQFVKKYCPNEYDNIFRNSTAGNYVAYSGNKRSCRTPEQVKGVSKEAFSEFLLKKLRNLKVAHADQSAYEDMISRLECQRFLPKQKDTDNRIIPQQLYRQELAAILQQAKEYLPFLSDTDEHGMTVAEKILSVFDFRIPYYVGPLAKHTNSVAWIERKAGRILPWNFEELVDQDASEQRFISRMTNTCTYLPGEPVLPIHSLLYEKFTVLNELNNLKVDSRHIPVAVKQALFTDLFMQKPRVSVKDIRNYLEQHGHITKQANLSGLDIAFKASLKSHHIFSRMLKNGILTEAEVEQVICQAAYTEDRSRLSRWLRDHFPRLSAEDINYIIRQKLKEFGRLSGEFLNGIYGTETNSDGEAYTIIEALWHTNNNMMQLLSDRFTFSEQIQQFSQGYYRDHPRTLTDRLAEMYVPGGAKRSIFRTLDVVSDIVKAVGAPPAKIFIEMARGGTEEQRGKRTQSRKAQLLELYKKIKTDDVRQLAAELEAMGDMAENKLQERKLFLYYLQLGKCMYTGEPIQLDALHTGKYNLDHIYPQSFVKDDSLLNNLVLVSSEANGQKSNSFPVPKAFRQAMDGYWQMLKAHGLITDEKYRRLTRPTPFTEEEKLGFISRQLVETRQSTKALAILLQEKYPEAKIVYVKAGLVSEFRQEFKMPKSRTVNDLHHAKDAYLNLVVGNVYDLRFSKRWFRPEEHYNVQVKKLFSSTLSHGDHVYWHGEDDLANTRRVMAKNAIHLTRFTFIRKGGLFDQQPVKKAPGLVPLKKGLPTEKYGGYNKPTAACFLLASFTLKKKREVMVVPVALHLYQKVMASPALATEYAAGEIASILGHAPEDIKLLLNCRPLKINTVFSLDGTRMTLAGKSSGGKDILLSPLMALQLDPHWEAYVKAIESFSEKNAKNKAIVPDERHDHISAENNLQLYRILTQKMSNRPFCKHPGNQQDVLAAGESRFAAAGLQEQALFLISIMQLLGAGSAGVDLSLVGGAKKAGTKVISAKLSNWAKRYSDVRILDMSSAGLFCKRSDNLLELL